MGRSKGVFLRADPIGKIQCQLNLLQVPEKDKFVCTLRNFISCILIFIFINSFGVLEANLAYGDTPKVNQPKHHLRVGIFDYFPIVFEKNGVPTGFQLELLKHVAEKEGWDLEFQFAGTFKNVLNGLEHKTLDIGMGIVPTDARREFLDFTKENHSSVKGQVFVRYDRQDIREMSDLSGKKVGYIREDALGTYFNEICEKLGVSPTLKLTNSYDDLLAALIAGDVDAGIFNSLQGERYSKKYTQIGSTPIIFKPMDVQYAVPKGSNSFIIDTLDSHLLKCKITEGSSYHTLTEEFLRDSAQLKPVMSKRDVILVLCIGLLFVIMGILVGNFLVKKMEAGSLKHSSAYVRDIVIFTLFVSASFWVIDSMMLWFNFNDNHSLTFMELAITKIPADNIYIRGMFILMSCFFGLFLMKYVGRYEEKYHVLLVSVDRFEKLTDNAKDMIFHMSLPSGKYEFVNKASSQIFGYSPEEFYKNPMFIKELIHHSWMKYFRSQWEDLLIGKIPPSYEYQIVRKDGEVRWMNQRNTLYFDESGIPNAVEGIITDVTEQKSSEAVAESSF